MSSPNLELRKSNASKIAVASLMLAASVAVRAEPQLHYWPANDSAQDMAGGADGTLNGPAYYDQGLWGHSFHLSMGAWVDLGATTANFETLDFVVSFAIKTFQTEQSAIMAKRHACGHGSFWSIRMGNGQLCIEVDDGQGNYTEFNSSINTTLADGNWHSVVLVRRGATTTLFIDGQPNSAGVAPTGVPANVVNADPLQVGLDACTYRDGTMPFIGSIDEIMISAK